MAASVFALPISSRVFMKHIVRLTGCDNHVQVTAP